MKLVCGSYSSITMTNPRPGLWTFTRMALQMVIELGLHRERSCLEPSGPQEEHQPNQQNLMDPSKKVSLNDYDQSSETLLFWIVYTLDVSLCNGTGRVPGLKRHEINVRLPTDTDLAVIRAGPGGLLVREVQCSSPQAVIKRNDVNMDSFNLCNLEHQSEDSH